jgi:hypothetical protein
VTDTHIDFDGVERFHSSLDDRVRSKMARPGDAVVTTKGNSTGRTAFVSSTMPPFVYSPHLSYWRSLDSARIEAGFLRYWSKSAEFADQLAGMKTSTDMAPYLSLVDQKRLQITLPAIEQQRTIARVLGALDDKVELNRRMSETLESMARALFKSWFIDFDPVRTKMEGRASTLPNHLARLFPASFRESELGHAEDRTRRVLGRRRSVGQRQGRVSGHRLVPSINREDHYAGGVGDERDPDDPEVRDGGGCAWRHDRPDGPSRPGHGDEPDVLRAGQQDEAPLRASLRIAVPNLRSGPRRARLRL